MLGIGVVTGAGKRTGVLTWEGADRGGIPHFNYCNSIQY